jgi:hypothetical protein
MNDDPPPGNGVFSQFWLWAWGVVNINHCVIPYGADQFPLEAIPERPVFGRCDEHGPVAVQLSKQLDLLAPAE